MPCDHPISDILALHPNGNAVSHVCYTVALLAGRITEPR
jgi:hypothetical protein